MDVQMKKSLDAIFKPRSVALIGASNNPSTWGHQTLRSIVTARYRHKIYPINPKEKEIQGFRCYPNITAVPEEIDLAIIVVNASLVRGIIQECIDRKVKGGIVISAGFAEIGDDGAEYQKRIVEESKKAGFYFIGPNCLGVVSSEANLCTAFDEGMDPPKGPISFVSQSGTLGWQFYDAAVRDGFGMSKLISCGNQASIAFIDLIEYLGDDPSTEVILGYMEDVGDGRRFLEITESLSTKKPLLLLKAGDDDASARAVRTHTAAIAGDDEIFDAACRQSGVIRCRDINELFDTGYALCYQPLPDGNRVAVVSDGGGFNVITAQACARMGLSLPEMSAQVQGEMLEEMQPFAPPPLNPVDCIAMKNDASYLRIVEIAASQKCIDILVVMPFMGRFDRTASPERMIERIKLAEGIARIPERFNKPLFLISEHHSEGPAYEIFKRYNIPILQSSIQCATAISGLVRYAEIRRKRKA